MAYLETDMTVNVEMEPGETVKQLIAEEVTRQLDLRWEKLLSSLRLGSAIHFEPSRPATDSRGIPHHMMITPEGGAQKES